MLVGAAGTIVMNLLFGAASFWGILWFFVLIRGIDGFLQAYGAQRLGIFTLGPALLAGFTFLAMWQVPPLHWRWLFWIPSGIAAAAAIVMALKVKNTPLEARFPGVHPEEDAADAGPPPPLREVFRTIMATGSIWFVVSAYACTGAVRQGIDQWFPRFIQDVHHVDLHSRQFKSLGFLIPFVASARSLISGYVSDKVFDGRRAPVAAALYFTETALVLTAAQFSTVTAAIVFLVLISFTANATHSILGTAAAMDIGGRRMAGFASGLIDSFQYFGGSLAGLALGKLLDRSWNYYFYFMAPFGLLGRGLLPVSMRRPQGKADRSNNPVASAASRELK